MEQTAQLAQYGGLDPVSTITHHKLSILIALAANCYSLRCHSLVMVPTHAALWIHILLSVIPIDCLLMVCIFIIRKL